MIFIFSHQSARDVMTPVLIPNMSSDVKSFWGANHLCLYLLFKHFKCLSLKVNILEKIPCVQNQNKAVHELRFSCDYDFEI